MYISPVLVIVLVVTIFSSTYILIFVNSRNPPGPPAPNYIGDVAINCGSVVNSTALDGREWIAEDAATSIFRSDKSRSSTAAQKSSYFSIDPVPYKTSRISSTEFGYTFEVNPGQKFIRLHFYPASYLGFENSIDFFTVKAGPFTLLKDFSASHTAETLGVKYLVKEFCLNVEGNRKFNITFLPFVITKSNLKIHAFVNGIEIISMPTGLYYTPDGDLGAIAVGRKNLFRSIDNGTALELTHRLNIGGSFISSVEDLGMFRRWSEDANYLLESRVHRATHQVHRIKYAHMQAFIAPPKVYQTSWIKTGGSLRVNQMYNFTWKMPIELGFGYLIRLHFCKLDGRMVESEEREFSVLIDNHIAETRGDIIRWSGGHGIPVYRDYMVEMESNKGNSRSDLLIVLQSVNESVLGLLNGVEIFKLSNHEKSLATPNPTFPKRLSASWNLRIHKVFLGFGQINVIMTVMTILVALVNVVVYNLRQNWEEKFHLEKDAQAAKIEPSYHHFSLAEIKIATQNFSDAFVIGKGGFGKVYKGFIRSIAEDVAIKRLSLYSRQGAREFWTEIETLSKLRHIHLVSLLGYCNEDEEMILVYEYMPSGTLADNLYKLRRKGKDIASLSWEQRLRICIGAARGIDYLHTGTECTVIHRDVKDSNILLDENFVAKISDFGLSKLENITQSKSYVSTKIKGTAGYWDPEYVMTRRLTRKSDVYSFGVVLLVVLAGRPVVDTRNQEEQQSLLSCFRECIAEGDVDRVVDPSLQGKISTNSLREFLKSVENCLHHLPKKRPTMAQVVASLEQALEQQERPMPSAPIYATVVSQEEVPIIGENVIPSPEEGIKSDSTENPYSPTIGNDMQSRNTGNARVPKSSWNWPWKAFWNRGKGHVIFAPTNVVGFSQEEVPVLGENVISSPDEGITSESTENPYSPTMGNDLQSRKTDHAPVPKSSRNWPWKSVRNRGKDGLRKMDIEILQEKSEGRVGKDGLGVGFEAIDTKMKEKEKGEGDIGKKNGLVFLGEVGRGFDLGELLEASAEVLGKGLVGTTYIVKLETGITVAVKKLRDVNARLKEFREKTDRIWNHVNLVPLLAYYYSREEKLLLYEYLPMGSLHELLHGKREPGRTPLNWETRAAIALGAARGITYLHSQGPSVLHGNIKSSNVLLTTTYEARISEFGFAQLVSSNHILNRVAGYQAPEVTGPRKISQEADVYSFGVLLLELLSGKAPSHSVLNEEGVDLPRWVQSVVREEWTGEVFDLELVKYENAEEDMVQLLQIALCCTAQRPNQRPSMAEVTNLIEEFVFTQSN
ncbi:hypothetical protein ACH5RR_016383 [Cinchona calisaya]|uniref:Protein kinase domain-containing protein n=1 Tax=Cinchona calisaya TaxID=153742 RepID=A0ABD2ZWS9_9GENT